MRLSMRIHIAVLTFFVFILQPSFGSAYKKAESFRTVAYVTSDSIENVQKIDVSHFEQLTDVILIGASDFDTDGNIVFKDSFETVYRKLRAAMKYSNANLYLNIIGPGCTVESDVWEEQMESLASRHDIAFKSGNLEQNIKEALEKYDFDGVMFDYEYPLTKKHWRVFDSFLVSLDKALGDEYKIGCAIAAWNTRQSRKAIKVLDLVELMSYDFWNGDGIHAPMLETQQCVRQMLLKGYKKKQLDLGIPFYGRPITQEAYWYGYNGWYDKLDGRGLVLDGETGLTFSFNNYDTVYQKTRWAIKMGLGGVMVWHYACDVPKENSLSLFNAVSNARTDLMK